MYLLSSRDLLLLPLVLFAVSAHSFSCSVTDSSIDYDLSALSGLRVADKQSSTPPTTSEAKVMVELCKSGGIPKEDGVADEDQCEANSRVCLKILNDKSSDPNPTRVTSVITIWPGDLPDDRISTTPLGKNGQDGVKIYVQGPDYAGNAQHLNLTLMCNPSGSDPNPSFISYGSNVLTLEWATPDACPRSGDNPVIGGDTGHGISFWGFVKFIFWMGLLALILYFGIGIFYNHQQYSARGWDLLPHRDFWRDFPGLIQDLFSHVFAGLRGAGSGGGGGRGAYSSLG